MHKIVRAPLRALAPTRVRPNHLTYGRLVTGLAASVGFATQEPEWVLWSAAVFFLSMLLDRADGELARLQNSSSAFGHKLDIVSDAVVNAAIMVAIGLAVRGGALGDWSVLMGIVAGGAVAYVLLVMVRAEQILGNGTAKFEGAGGFDPDDAMIALPLAMVFGLGEWVLVAATVGAPLAAIVITLHFQRLRRAR